jgi:hypothetical protein
LNGSQSLAERPSATRTLPFKLAREFHSFEQARSQSKCKSVQVQLAVQSASGRHRRNLLSGISSPASHRLTNFLILRARLPVLLIQGLWALL